MSLYEDGNTSNLEVLTKILVYYKALFYMLNLTLALTNASSKAV